MVCCGCSTLAASTIYEKFAKLVDLGFLPSTSATFRQSMLKAEIVAMDATPGKS